jgi:hypothetical protein
MARPRSLADLLRRSRLRWRVYRWRVVRAEGHQGLRDVRERPLHLQIDRAGLPLVSNMISQNRSTPGSALVFSRSANIRCSYASARPAGARCPMTQYAPVSPGDGSGRIGNTIGIGVLPMYWRGGSQTHHQGHQSCADSEPRLASRNGTSTANLRPMASTFPTRWVRKGSAS